MPPPDPGRFTSAILHHAADPFRLLVESVKDYAIYLLDPTGRIASWNTGAERIKGYTAEEVLGKPFDLMFAPEDRAAGTAGRVLAAALADGKYEQEGPRPRKDGSTFWALYTVTALHENGWHIGFAVVLRDITERKRAEEAVRRERDLADAILDSLPGIYYLYDESRKFHRWNKRFEAVTGCSAEEVAAAHPLDFFTGDERDLLRDRIADVFRTGNSEAEAHFVAKDGTRTPYYFNGVQAVIDGRPLLLGMGIDITARKRAEEALRVSEERFRLMIDCIKDYAIYTLDSAGTILSWNDGATRIYGYAAAEIIGQHRGRFFTPESVAKGMPQRELDTAMADGKASDEGWRVRKDGTLFWANGTMSALRDETGRLRGFVKVIRDLTESKRVETELRLSEKRFRSLVTAVSQLVWTIDAAGENHVTTPSWAEYTGLPEEEVRGWGWLNAVHPDDRDQTAQKWRHSLETKEPFAVGYRIRRADGQWRHFRVRGVPLRDDDGTVREWVGVCIDDTDRYRAEEAARLRDRAIEAVPQGIVISDPKQPDNPIVYANRGFERLTGYPAEEIIGRNCRFLQGEGTDPTAVTAMHEAVLAGREFAVEILNYKRDGTPFWNATSFTPVRDEAGKVTHFIGVLADVTERRELEQAFHQAQKMEAIGQLAGGVAHDFNNILTVIAGFSDLLLMETDLTDEHREMVAEIRQAGARATDLTRQLLAFSRKQIVEPVVLDLNDVVARSDKMLRRLIGEDVLLATVLAPDTPPVKADPGQVDQVLLNLCVNARDAMPAGGRLTVETREVVLEDGPTADPDLGPGRYAQLSVTDTGHGMTDEVMARVFEPFFTTKEQGKGTGLGLATVFGIVKQSGGRVSVYSEVGVGTTFKVYFPAADESPTLANTSRPTHPLEGTETVLLVDDEPGVREVARISLEAQGYTVLEASGGAAALGIADRHPGPIHLLVTDVVMPEMGGRQLADTLRARRPGVKVLYASGYTDDAVIRHGIIGRADNFLQKPFAPLGLAKKVRELLDG